LGFSDNIKVLVGFNPEGEILGYTILQSSETPGLGAKADKWFQEGQKGNIIGKNLSKETLAVKKDGGNIDAITASTITSRAFLKAVNQAYNAYVNKEVDGQSGASQQKVAKR
jgi:electron transport complex protein RnfG